MTSTDSAAILPLSGIRVVAVEQAVAAPLATRHLADLGADVIKIERIGQGDFARGYDNAVDGMASHFVWLNRGKRSVALDLKSQRGIELVTEMIASADVFVQNLAPGAAERIGLDTPTLQSRFPRLIVASITGYGRGGPWSGRKAYDMLVQAETGLISLTGTEDAPAKTGIPTSDIAAGMYLYTAVLAGLIQRHRTGKGISVETSLYDATIEWMGNAVHFGLHTGRQLPRMGVSHATIAPYNSFATKDGHVLIGIQNDRGWDALCRKVFFDDELADDTRFSTNLLRVENRSACDAAVLARCATFTTSDLEERLESAGVPAARMADLTDLLASEQLRARDRWRTVGTEVGPVQALLPPFGLGGVDLPMRDVPALGQHSDEVLAAFGLSGRERRELRERGVVQ